MGMIYALNEIAGNNAPAGCAIAYCEVVAAGDTPQAVVKQLAQFVETSRQWPRSEQRALAEWLAARQEACTYQERYGIRVSDARSDNKWYVLFQFCLPDTGS